MGETTLKGRGLKLASRLVVGVVVVVVPIVVVVVVVSPAVLPWVQTMAVGAPVIPAAVLGALLAIVPCETQAAPLSCSLGGTKRWRSSGCATLLWPSYRR